MVTVYGFSGKNQKATNTYIKQLPLNWKRQTQVKLCKCTIKLIQNSFTMRGLVHVVVRIIASVIATRGLLLYILHSIVFDVIQLRAKQSNKTDNIEIYIYIFAQNRERPHLQTRCETQ